MDVPHWTKNPPGVTLGFQEWGTIVSILQAAGARAYEAQADIGKEGFAFRIDLDRCFIVAKYMKCVRMCINYLLPQVLRP